MSFLSMRLSSTAKTWNWDSLAAITIVYNQGPIFQYQQNGKKNMNEVEGEEKKEKVGAFFGSEVYFYIFGM